MNQELARILDTIGGYLWEGIAFHSRCANEMRKIAMRGLARAHEFEADTNFKQKQCLEKLLRDNLDYALNVDTSSASGAATYTLASPTDLRKHLTQWREREQDFISTLNGAISLSGAEDMGLYCMLCDVIKDVQEETQRVHQMQLRFELSGYNGHDIGVCNMVLHKHYEDHCNRNWNIG